jgi:L-alanine-DL-glutamate epimerase-like enolase superfamily enzyme
VTVLDELAELDPYWVEAPVAEHRLSEWAHIRRRSQLRLAGGEMMTGISNFRRFIEESGVDVVMPDIKYVGGITGLRDVAAISASHGRMLAPHNPSGPVGTLASAHAASALPNFLTLEYAFGECDWRSPLVCGAENIVDGELRLGDASGYGATLDASLVARYPQRPVAPLDVRLFG